MIAALVFLMGVTIRHYFNTKHAGGKAPMWTWLATAILFIFIVHLSMLPMWKDGSYEASDTRPPDAHRTGFCQCPRI